MNTKNETEWIKGPNLSVFIKASKGVPFEEGLARADGENRVLASNSRLDKALVNSNEWESVRAVFPCWSGTLTAYLEPGQKLGKQVVSVDPETGHRWVFAVPEPHRGRKNSILVAEHPDYSLEIDGNNRVVHAKTVDLVEKFPAEYGWYTADPVHDIPAGRQVEFSSQARHLWRADRRVGPVARYFVAYNCGNGQGVGLSGRPSNGFGDDNKPVMPENGRQLRRVHLLRGPQPPRR
ncbi:MAG: hypothetical protein L0Y56_17085, partial [Nitrospira sp.]|nr:hypothetical protein [Nitrospira sp.]